MNDEIYRKTPGDLTMYDYAKVKAFSAWHDLLVSPDVRMNVQEHYDELLRLADYFREKGIIDPEERKTLIEVATLAYMRAVEDTICEA
jgi:hypothetical protein